MIVENANSLHRYQRMSNVQLSTTPGEALDSTYNRIQIAVLGGPGVGKTSIVEQFVNNGCKFNIKHTNTKTKQNYHPVVMINNHFYEIHLCDYPSLCYFPTDTLTEWTHYRGYQLLSADAYILVFDITSDDSFQYIKDLREQIVASRHLHDIAIFVVGNKQDLNDDRTMSRREIQHIIKKQWKCSAYLECSAKHNWHIVNLFKEILKTIDDNEHIPKATGVTMQDVLNRNKCVIS